MPIHYLVDPSKRAELIARYAGTRRAAETSYATVRDYCDSVDHLPPVAGTDGDLKNVQRPWAIKTLLANIPPPARILEIGGGEPIVSGFLSELGYDAMLIDPYDGFGNGPTEFEQYAAQFPHVQIRREYFRPDIGGLTPESFDAIFSISVLEHISLENLASCFAAIGKFLSPNGASIHCFDFILQGAGETHDLGVAEKILSEQARLTSKPPPNFPALLETLRADLETFFLSPQGHHNWRGGQSYDAFPFRKVASIQCVGFKTAPESFNR